MKNQMSVYDINVESLQKLSKELFISALFDAKNPSVILAKLLAGKEMGFGPIASISGIYIISGKPAIGANLIATSIANHPRYSYKILKSDDMICEIEFFENKESIGSCKFDADEAKKAELWGKAMWKKYPSDMLFARCISRGARRFTPGVFGGTPVYTPEELNVNMDEDGRIIDAEPIREKKEIKLASLDQITYFHDLCAELDIGGEKIIAKLAKRNISKVDELQETEILKWIKELEDKKQVEVK
jgi:hypothetical protein